MMEAGETFLSCAVTMEWTNQQGSILKKVSYKNASLRLIRNEFRDMFMEVSGDSKSAVIKLLIKKINVFKKFMVEGKASIKFEEDKCTIFISNAPPTNLISFLRTIFVKMTGDKEAVVTPSKRSLRAQLLSGKAKTFEEISPVTTSDILNAQSKISRATTTTPSPSNKKRKSENLKGPEPKKLYSTNALTTSPLNAEQSAILEACIRGRNIFFTGSAGTGKSYLLKHIIAALPPDSTYSTASTGVAACHIGGTTLHAFAGIGDGQATVETCTARVLKTPLIVQKWRKCKHLVIDEISMVDGNFFEKMEAVARIVRNNNKPFGGIQLILCGDFLQLPPVVDNSKNKKKRFCFQSQCWEQCVEVCFELKEVHRQKDKEFISILNSIRIGRVTKEITATLQQTAKQNIESDNISATRLCTHTNDSKLINSSKLEALDGEKRVFAAQDTDNYSQQLDVQTIAPSKLVLKIGAQVMLLKNINVNAGLVNGARGVVVRYEDDLPVVRFKNKKEYVARSERWYIRTNSGALISRKQIPLDLAWAFSIHKSQGLTLDCVEMSLSKIFEAGQAYVALSRAQCLKSLRVLDFDASHVWADPDVLQFYQKFRRKLQMLEVFPLSRPIKNDERKEKLRDIIMKRLKV